MQSAELGAAGSARDELVVRVEASPGRGGVTPLTSATATVNGVRALLFEAAQEAGRELGLPATYVVMSAEAFLQVIDVSAEQGSFVWRFHIPIEFWGAPARPVLEDAQPYGRLTTVILERWLEALHRPQPSLEYLDEELDHAEPLISTLLPNAQRGDVTFEFRLAELPGRGAGRSGSVTFTPEEVPRLVTVVRERAPYREGIDASASTQRAEGPPQAPELIESFVLVGEVIALRWPEITVAGDVLGRTRRVRLTLARPDYERAATAHIAGFEVTVVGVLELRLRSSRMREIEAFWVRGEQ